MLKFLAAIAAALALAPTMTLAAIAETNLATGTGNSHPVTATTSVASPGGALIFMAGATVSSNKTITTFSDSASNVYTLGNDLVQGNIDSRAAYVSGAATVANGGSVSMDETGGGSFNGYVAAATVSGVASASALDVSGAGVSSASGTAPSISTGVLAQPIEIVFAWCAVQGGASDTYTQASGFTTLADVTTATADALHVAYAIVSSTASVTFAPTLGTARAYACNVMTFKGAAAGGHTLMLMRMGVAANDNHPLQELRLAAG
jgi:hypothetical protein